MAKNKLSFTAAIREKQSKGGNKRFRKEGKIPCVLYGHGVDPVSILVELREILSIIDHPSIVTLNFSNSNDKRDVLVKDVQYDYLGSNIVHVDFQQVKMDEKITAEIHVEVFGEPIGTKVGGQLDQIMHTVEVECLPNDLPERIVYDVSELDVGDSILVSNLPVPEGVKIVCADPNAIAIHVIHSRLAAEEQEGDEGDETLSTKKSDEPEVITKGKKEEAE